MSTTGSPRDRRAEITCPTLVTAPASAPHQDLPRIIGFWGATGVMIGIIIGSGIFNKPPAIAADLSSPILILLMWLAGGILALLGALTYAELACMFPQSGGVYVFIREGFGKAAAFVFGWTYMLITKPFAAAGIAFVFSQHLAALLGKDLNVPLVTAAALITLTAINAWGVRLSAGFAVVLTALKVAALLAIIAAAAWLGRLNADALAPAPLPEPRPLISALVAVMVSVMWTYDGWSDVGAIAGEVRNPQKMLPRIYLLGTAAITLVYVLVNLAYMGIVPLGEMRTLDTVAPTVAQRLFGNAGMLVILIVIISTLGSSHGSIMTGARVTFAQARDGLMFRFLGAVAPRRQTPHVALWVQCALSCTAAIGLGDFNSLADGFTFTMWIFYGLAGAAIFVLRRTRPDIPRPFRCWGYPLTPALFVLSAVIMTAVTIYNDPWRTVPWLIVLAVGWPVYWVWKGMTKPIESSAARGVAS